MVNHFSRQNVPEETEELALAVNGRKNRLTRRDFLAFAERVGVASSYASRRVDELYGHHDDFQEMIGASALSEMNRRRLRQILSERLGRLAPGE